MNEWKSIDENFMKFQDETKVHSRNIIYTFSSFIKCSSFQFLFFFPLITKVNQVPWMNIIHEFSMDAVSLMNMDKISSMKKLNFHGNKGCVTR
jgi:hypothetical protein